MKKIIFFISLYLCCTLSAFSEETVVKLAIGEWAPFTSEKEQNGKLAEEVVSAAFGLEGIRVEYAYFPWARSMAMTENGDYDGTFPWLKTADRMEIFHPSQNSLIQDEGVFFHLKTTPFDWKTLEDLKKYRVGVTIGYANEGIYKKAGIKADAVPKEELNFKKMLGDRIDVYQTSKAVGYYMINKFFTPAEATQFTHHPTPTAMDNYYILFPKKSPKAKFFNEKFDSGFAKLKASGEYDRILAKYMGKS